jgi:hypothetical protein
MTIDAAKDILSVLKDSRSDQVPAKLVRDLGWAFGHVRVATREPYQHTKIFSDGEVPLLV